VQQAQIILTPTEVTATYSKDKLTIVAEGREDGVNNIDIVQSPKDIVPNTTFAVVGERAELIGMFPYRVERQFPMQGDPEYIEIERQMGTPQRVPVKRK